MSKSSSISHHATLGLDNQATIRSSRSREPGPGRYLMDEFHRLKQRWKKQVEGTRFTIRWVPGHVSIEGNERSDEEAKAAAQGLSSPPRQLPSFLRKDLPTSSSRAKQNRKSYIKERAAAQWKDSPRQTRMARVSPDLSIKRYQKLTHALSRRHTALLFQLRTGHVALNYHLYRIGCADSPIRPNCEEQRETVDHFLLYCPVYARARLRILYTHGATALSTSSLLNRERMLPELFEFIHTTGRF